MADSQSTTRYRLQALAAIAVVVILVAWLGMPTFNKWRADRFVDELCAKDGGIKVYEAVRLPEERFDKFGEIYVPSLKEAKPMDEFYYVSETQWIKKSDDVFALVMWRNHDRLFRAAENKLLGEAIGYSRRGGDPISPLHISSYACPIDADIKFVKQKVFVKN